MAKKPLGCLWIPADHQIERWTLQLPREEEVEPTYQRTRVVQHLQRIFAYFLNATLVLLHKERPSSLWFRNEQNTLGPILDLQNLQTQLLIASYTGKPVC